MSIAKSPGYISLMATVKVLDTHYSRVAGKARRALLDAKFRNDSLEAEKYRKLLKRLRSAHEKALNVIADKLTLPKQIQHTRKSLRAAADKAYDFLQRLKKVKMTLKDLTDAVGFMEQLVKDIRKIL